jgi:hypothetical protein
MLVLMLMRLAYVYCYKIILEKIICIMNGQVFIEHLLYARHVPAISHGLSPLSF